jgi:hypothetical protein
MPKLIALIFTLLSFTSVYAQSTSDGVMIRNEKIYVVMAVCLTILLGLIIYIIRIDRKISKLEQNKKD